MDDNQRLFARHRTVLLVVTLAGLLVGLASSLLASKQYTATASVQVQDLSDLESIVGATPPSSGLLPGQLSAGAIGTVTSDGVLGEVLAAVPAEHSITDLRSHVTATVDPASGLLKIGATASTARRAATIANDAATATVTVTNAQAQARFAAQAKELQQQISQLPGSGSSAGTRSREQTNLTRLRALAVVAQPASVTQPADLPTSATSSQVAFSSLLGAVIGLIVALVIAGVRELFDRTVHAPVDLADRLRLPIIGHVDEGTLGTLPFLSPAPSAAESAAMARFGVLRKGVELLGESEPPRSVLVTSAAPAEGKTTVAASLAGAFSEAGRSTVLLEADLRRPVLAERLGLRATPGLAEYLRGECGLTDVLQPTAGPSEGEGRRPRSIVAGSFAGDPAALLASPRVRELLGELLEIADTVVVDAPPVIPVADALELMAVFDAYLVCVRASSTSLAELEAVGEMVERLPKRPGAVVVTGVSKGRYELGGYAAAYGASPVRPSAG
jgi:capsular exopolysaccharide synthesis family protein